MSYDVTIGGDWSNYTYNVGPMLHAAGLHLNELDGYRISEFKRLLKRTLKRMEKDPARYKALNPPNGWGDYEGCLGWLRAMVGHCERHSGRVSIT